MHETSDQMSNDEVAQLSDEELTAIAAMTFIELDAQEWWCQRINNE
jgi:hypothetical protein